METANHNHQNLNKISFAGLLVTLGALSAVFWTLTIQTTIKYILIVLSADNNGEGGVFSLYNLIYEKAAGLRFSADSC